MTTCAAKLSSIAPALKEYFGHVAPITSGINFAETTEVEKIPEKILALSAEIKQATISIDSRENNSAEKLDDAVLLYDLFSSAETLLQSIKDYQENAEYVRAAAHKVTNPEEMILSRETLGSKLVLYYDAKKQFDLVQLPQIIESIGLENPTSVDMAIDHLISVKNPNRFTAALMAKLMPIAGKRKSELIKLVEKQKNDVLGASPRSPPPVRWGLIPATKCFPAPVIIGIIAGEIPAEGPQTYKTSSRPETKSGGWRDFSADECAMIVRTGTPVEFLLDSICNEEFVEKHDLKIPLVHGINKKVLEKYNTATLLNTKERARAIPFRCRGTSGWVLETITNGTSFRILSADGTVRKTSRVEAPGLFESSGEKIISRSAEYHKCQSPVIIGKCINKRRDDVALQFEEFDNHRPSAGAIMQKIVDGYMRGVADKLDEHGIPHSVEEAKSIFLNHKLATEVISEILVHNNGTRSLFSAEYLFTYIAHFDTIDTSFIREIDNNWQKSAIDDRIFKEYAGPQLRDVILTAYRRVVVGAVEVLDQAGSWSGYDWSQKTFFIDRR